MAEGFLRKVGGDRFEVYSAATHPRPIHPVAVEVMADRGIDISRHSGNHALEHAAMRFDFIISPCDKAKEDCPLFPGDPLKTAWNFEDPAASNERSAFIRSARDMNGRAKMSALVQSKSLLKGARS